jgi:hypothetical protein
MLRCWLAVLLMTAVVATAAEVKVRVLKQGSQSGIQKAERVIVRTQKDWEQLWTRSLPEGAPKSEPPKVDWSNEMVVAVFLGSKSTGGYATRVVGTRELDGKLEIQLEERRPAPGGIVTQAFTSAYAMAAVPKSQLPVIWKVVGPR